MAGNRRECVPEENACQSIGPGHAAASYVDHSGVFRAGFACFLGICRLEHPRAAPWAQRAKFPFSLGRNRLSKKSWIFKENGARISFQRQIGGEYEGDSAGERPIWPSAAARPGGLSACLPPLGTPLIDRYSAPTDVPVRASSGKWGHAGTSGSEGNQWTSCEDRSLGYVVSLRYVSLYWCANSLPRFVWSGNLVVRRFRNVPGRAWDWR